LEAVSGMIIEASVRGPNGGSARGAGRHPYTVTLDRENTAGAVYVSVELGPDPLNVPSVGEVVTAPPHGGLVAGLNGASDHSIVFGFVNPGLLTGLDTSAVSVIDCPGPTGTIGSCGGTMVITCALFSTTKVIRYVPTGCAGLVGVLFGPAGTHTGPASPGKARPTAKGQKGASGIGHTPDVKEDSGGTRVSKDGSTSFARAALTVTIAV